MIENEDGLYVGTHQAHERMKEKGLWISTYSVQSTALTVISFWLCISYRAVADYRRGWEIHAVYSGSTERFDIYLHNPCHKEDINRTRTGPKQGVPVVLSGSKSRHLTDMPAKDQNLRKRYMGPVSSCFTEGPMLLGRCFSILAFYTSVLITAWEIVQLIMDRKFWNQEPNQTLLIQIVAISYW